MGDDALNTTAIESNGTIKLSQQVFVVVSDIGRTDTPTLLALGEDVVSRHTAMYQVHEHRNTRTIVSTKRCIISVPMGLGLLDLVVPLGLVHSIHMGYKQSAVLVRLASIDMEITNGIQERHLCEMLGQTVGKPLCE